MRGAVPLIDCRTAAEVHFCLSNVIEERFKECVPMLLRSTQSKTWADRFEGVASEFAHVHVLEGVLEGRALHPLSPEDCFVPAV